MQDKAIYKSTSTFSSRIDLLKTLSRSQRTDEKNNKTKMHNLILFTPDNPITLPTDRALEARTQNTATSSIHLHLTLFEGKRRAHDMH